MFYKVYLHTITAEVMIVLDVFRGVGGCKYSIEKELGSIKKN